jgi:microcystin-dependent protein
MKSNVPTINDLPIQRDFKSGEKIIIERNRKGSFLLDFDNIYIRTRQINFRQSLLEDSAQVGDLNALAIIKLNEILSKITTSTKNNYTVDLNKYTSLVQLQNKEYITTNVDTPSPFSKANNIINFDSASVNNSTAGGFQPGCNNNQIALQTGIISMPKGTYKLNASITLSPEIDTVPVRNIPSTFSSYNEMLDFIFNTIEDPLKTERLKEKQPVWSYMSFVQLLPSERAIINGTGATTFTVAGNSITLNLNGYFYADGNSQYCVKLYTLGNLYSGINNSGTYPLDDSLENLDNRLLSASLANFFQRAKFNQIRFYLDKLSDTDILSPREDSPRDILLQPLRAVAKVPLIHKSGWAQKIFTISTNKPTLAQYTINSLPYEKKDTYFATVRGSICYITEPSAYRGNVKIGDTVKFINISDANFAFPIHDIRDSIFNTPGPGWYGLLTNTNATSSSQYNSIFKLDTNGVIIDKVIISLSDNCLPAISPPSVARRSVASGSSFGGLSGLDSQIGGFAESLFEVESTTVPSPVFLPTGSIVPYAGIASPDGWLLCDGSVKNISDYPDLSNIIRAQFGSITSTTFTLPDLRGRVVAGVDNMDNFDGVGGGIVNRLSGLISNGLTTGSESHLITSSQIGIPIHQHYTYAATNDVSQTTGQQDRLTRLAGPGGARVGAASIVSEDATVPHNNVQPTIILNYIIKT